MKQYWLNVDPRILELLGPNLYTDYVLAELIANTYDTDTKNVYLIASKEGATVCHTRLVTSPSTRMRLVYQER